MKKIIFIVAVTIAAACSKKTIPTKSANENVIIYNNNANNSGENIIPDTSATVNNASALAFIIVTDGFGKIINEQQALPPDENVHFDALQLSKGFTVQQRLNLKTRYKTIPPRVLYVNPKNRLSSARGTYYVLVKKFWYWKKKDGLFYLDEKYYL